MQISPHSGAFNEHSKVILIIQELYLDFSYLQHWEAPSQAGGCTGLQVVKKSLKKVEKKSPH